MNISEPLLNSMVEIGLTAVVSFVAAAYWANRRSVAAAKEVVRLANLTRDNKIVELERQLAVVSSAIVPISTAFQTILIKELTHFHTPELDNLLRRVGPPTTLTDLEVQRMEVLLREREVDMGDEITASERDAAHMLPMVIKRAKIESEALKVLIAGPVVQLDLIPPDIAPVTPERKENE